MKFYSVAIGLLLTAHFSSAEPTQLSQPSALEQQMIALISAGITNSIRNDFNKTGKAVRDAHAKAHGCVKGSFTVLKDIPDTEVRYGIFANAGKVYKVWIRYSNGSGDPLSDDRVAGGRGMAIKVTGVDGAKFMGDEKQTQDFQMINYPAFFVKDVMDYGIFEKDPGQFFATHPAEAVVVQALANPMSNPPINPLESIYFSMTPRQLGPVDKVRSIKFSAKPVACQDGKSLPAPLALQDNKDALRLALSASLKTAPACFEFLVQRYVNDDVTPVDNPVKIWDEKLAPFVSVAKIVIPAQSFESDAQKEFCEDLSITPWHSTEEHQPLGSIELARKTIYEATAKVRHELNQRPLREPTGDETF